MCIGDSAHTAFASLDSFTLMAIPFFMLAGNFMRYGGISKRLLDLADHIIGFVTGGLGAVTTLTCICLLYTSGRRRINVQQQDRLEREKDDFHVRTYEGYLELEKKYPGRIVGIDAARSIEEIKIDIYKKLEEVLKGVTE